MKILILCDRDSEQYYDQDLRSLVQKVVQETGSEVNTVVLNGDEIQPCKGCFQCWIKTPGLCTINTDCANEVSRLEIRSDAVILLSRITYGGYSYDIKSFLDRSIPNISPFFEIVKNEMRHKMRYERFPNVITIGYGACSQKEQQTFIGLTERNALNMRPPKHFVLIMKKPDEINEALGSLKNTLSTLVQEVQR